MYKTVLLTQREIEILETLIESFIGGGCGYEERNLTIILNHLRGRKPTENGAKNHNLALKSTNQLKIK